MKKKKKAAGLFFAPFGMCFILFWLVPFFAWWLNISLWQALVMDVGLLVFFLVYTFVFTWCFDRLFGLPASAQ